MSRISPIMQIQDPPAQRPEDRYSRLENLKVILGRSPVTLQAYSQWLKLYEEVERILGTRLASLYAHSISRAADCPLCSAFFGKVIAEAGEDPGRPAVTSSQAKLLELGNSIARHHGNVADHVYEAAAVQFSEAEMIVLLAFAGEMIAISVLNNVIETEVDKSLLDYLPYAGNHRV